MKLIDVNMGVDFIGNDFRRMSHESLNIPFICAVAVQHRSKCVPGRVRRQARQVERLKCGVVPFCAKVARCYRDEFAVVLMANYCRSAFIEPLLQIRHYFIGDRHDSVLARFGLFAAAKSVIC